MSESRTLVLRSERPIALFRFRREIRGRMGIEQLSGSAARKEKAAG
jgi:hypothetical protein